MQQNDLYKQLQNRVDKLENQRERDLEVINKNNTQLATIVVELKNITKSMNGLAKDWKEAITNSREKQKQDKEQIINRVSKLEENVKSLDDKIDDRTIEKNSEMWEKVKWLVISGILGAIVAVIAANIIK